MSQHYLDMKAALETANTNLAEAKTQNASLVESVANIKEDIKRILNGEQPNPDVWTPEEFATIKGLVDANAAAAAELKDAVSNVAASTKELADENKAPGEGEATNTGNGEVVSGDGSGAAIPPIEENGDLSAQG